MNKTILIAALNLILPFIYCTSEEIPLVKLEQGTVVGKCDYSTNGKRFLAFLGIPYAAPPIGKLRLKDPLPPLHWNGTYEATQIPNTCMQYNHFGYNVLGVEDCLYINVFTHKLPKCARCISDLKVVIVYIHGGAFTFSSGYMYGPHNLMDRDIVFVNFNYRLGPLGFLSTGDEVIPGNFGLKDQVLALKWVQKNIVAFGGNPEKVTIAGMSAGGVSVHYHMLSPHSKGLFNSAISMSGSVLCPWAQAEDSWEKALAIGKKLNCNLESSHSLLDCFQDKQAIDIVSLTKHFMPWLFLPFSPFGPVVEYSSMGFIEKKPIDSVKEGPVSDVPWLISFASQEGLYPGAEIICNETNLKYLINEWANVSKYLLDFEYTVPKENISQINTKILNKYINSNLNSYWSDLIRMLSDRLFIANIVEAGLLQSKAMKSQVYAYEFSYRGKNSASDYFCSTKKNYGVSHADDLGYATKVIYLNSNETTSDIAMKNLMVDLWVSFANSGKPKLNGYKGNWPSLQENISTFQFMEIKSPNVSTLVSKTDIGEYKFWSSLGLNENLNSK